jgi:hypothetical protein
MSLNRIGGWRMSALLAFLLVASLTPFVQVGPANAVTGSVAVTGDNGVELFINGVSQGTSSAWRDLTTVLVDLVTDDVVAVHATDAGGAGGFLAQIDLGGPIVVSDTSWKVTTTDPGAGWADKGFVDSGWDHATAYGTYGVGPWNTNVAGFPTDSTAEWIWSADATGDDDIYLRYIVGVSAPPDPAPVAPTNLVATAGDSVVDLVWDANTESDLTGYNIYRSLVSPVPTIVSLDSVTAGTETYSDTTAVNGTPYFYVVTATDDDPAESGASNEQSATPVEPT